MAFVNMIAFIAEARKTTTLNCRVHYNRCVVRWNTHDCDGISRAPTWTAPRASMRCWPPLPPDESHPMSTPQPRCWKLDSWWPAMAATAWWKRPTGGAASAIPAGKKSQAVVGDRVLWKPPPQARARRHHRESAGSGATCFTARTKIRTKSFAANLDQVLILIAAEPVFSESQLAARIDRRRG
jgi:hypothetical protein